MSCPSTSRTGTTFPGLLGSAIKGSSAERSISSSTSYDALASAASGRQTVLGPAPRGSGAFPHPDGKIVVTAPASTPTPAAMTCRSITFSSATPGP